MFGISYNQISSLGMRRAAPYYNYPARCHRPPHLSNRWIFDWERDSAACPSGTRFLPRSWTRGVPCWVYSRTLQRNGRSPKSPRSLQQAAPSARTRTLQRELLATQVFRYSKPWELSSRGALEAFTSLSYLQSTKIAFFPSCNPHFRLGRAPTRTGP